VQFRVCYNFLPHLRGNVFVEFQDQRWEFFYLNLKKTPNYNQT
jgi:hypothetical protein